MSRRSRPISRRPTLPKINEEMKRWCALIEEELSTWPRVTSRPMFGLVGYYRDRRIFAAIPRTRAVETPFSLLIKLPTAKPKGVTKAPVPGAGWVTFTLESELDVGEALKQLGRAYAKAGTSRSVRDRR